MEEPDPTPSAHGTLGAPLGPSREAGTGAALVARSASRQASTSGATQAPRRRPDEPASPHGTPLFSGLAFLRRPRAALALAAALLLVGGGLAALDEAHEVRRAPDFTVTTLDGDAVRLSDLRGTAVLLDLMAVDCPACRDVTARLVALAAERGHDGSAGLRILSIDVWDETPEALAGYANETGSGWSYALDEGGVEAAYGAWAVPKMVLVDRHGLVVWESLGLPGTKDLEDAVGEAVRGSAPGRVLSLPEPLPLAAGGLLLLLGPATLPLALLVRGASDGTSRARRLEVSATAGLLHLVAALVVGGAGLAAGAWLPGGLSFLLALSAVATFTLGGALLSGLAVPGFAGAPRGGALARAAAAGATTGGLGAATLLPFAAGLVGSPGPLGSMGELTGWAAASSASTFLLVLLAPARAAREGTRKIAALAALAAGTGLLVAYFRDFGGA